MIVAAAVLLAAAIVWAALRIAGELRAGRDDASHARTMTLLQLFAPAIAGAQIDPRTLLVWQPLARSARQLCPAEFAALDRASGATFPFTTAQLEAAHAQWTADWLAWEQSHDAEYKLKAALVQHEVAPLGPSTLARAKIEAVEREKLELYQRRYQSYVQTAKALQALL